LVRPLSPLSKSSRQASAELAQKWGRPVKVWLAGHLLGSLSHGLVLHGFRGQWTPWVTRILVISPLGPLKSPKLPSKFLISNRH
jgi:hypothetical protein